jgi:hypothetical protein
MNTNRERKDTLMSAKVMSGGEKSAKEKMF